MTKINGVADLDQELVQETLASMNAVNMDEVTNDVVRVRVSEKRSVPLLDDDGNPLIDDDGNPLNRIQFHTRTAEIYDLVPLPLYNKMIHMRDQLTGKKGSQDDAILPMGDLVYEVWKSSEPWMTKERFYASVHGETIAALFVRFFNRSRFQNSKV